MCSKLGSRYTQPALALLHPPLQLLLLCFLIFSCPSSTSQKLTADSNTAKSKEGISKISKPRVCTVMGGIPTACGWMTGTWGNSHLSSSVPETSKSSNTLSYDCCSLKSAMIVLGFLLYIRSQREKMESQSLDNRFRKGCVQDKAKMYSRYLK